MLDKRVLVLLESGESAKALILAESLVAAFPHRADVWFRFACANGVAGNIGAAREAAARSIELDMQWRERVLDEPMLEAIW